MKALLAEFDGSVCPACHHRAHDPGGCSECPRCELHTDEALAFVLRYEPELLATDGWEWQCAGCHRPVPPMGMCETCGVFGIMRLAEPDDLPTYAEDEYNGRIPWR